MKTYIMVPTDGLTFFCEAKSKADAYKKLAESCVERDKKALKKGELSADEIIPFKDVLIAVKDDFGCDEVDLTKIKNGLWLYL